MKTYTGVYASGWRATVRATNRTDAQRRLQQTGRGERFHLILGGTHQVWGRDEDDEYEEGGE